MSVPVQLAHRPAVDAVSLSVLLTLFLGLIPSVSAADKKPTEASEAEALFAHQIWPTISAKCLACHGDDPEKIKGGLKLQSREQALAGGDSGPALIPGKAKESLLFQGITWEDGEFQMPPKESERLSAMEVERIASWIDAGAPWPSPERIESIVQSTEDQWSAKQGIRVETSGGLKSDWTNRLYLPENLWAYQALQPIEPPRITESQHPIDAFIEQALASTQLAAAPRADRRTLIRRVTYDLIGLPPTPDEIQAYLSDPSSETQAFDTIVERLLASPHYGEHWGRHWLDVVRYADTSGFANDFERGNAWRYRDYVVRSFNQDKPYAQFAREQIAGDELDPDSPESRIATGFLRMGPWELTGMEVPAIARQRFLDDAVNAVGQTFLGHTLRCAKCHDHKFDPIPTRDYYSLYATFQTTQLAERKTSFLPNENRTGFEEVSYLRKQEARVKEQLKQLNAKSHQAIKAWFAERNLPYQTRETAQKAGLGPDEIPPRRYGFSVEDFGMERIARKTLARLEWELERYEPVAFSVYHGRTPKRTGYTSPQRRPEKPLTEGTEEKGFILMGGDAFSEGEPVTPSALSILNHQVPELARVQFPQSIAGRRQALAEWVTHPKNPLTARTIANRIWQWHFGIPLAGNPNNLGASGKKPTHPELLDWLAQTFQASGGSIKAMHRLILSSQAYQRSSAHPDPKELERVDSTGTSYARFRARRLTSEEFRDSMLAISGELNPALGGIPNRPEINLEVALQPRMVMGTFATAWQPNPYPAQRHRRSLYALKVRGLRDPFMEVFNEPDPDLSCEVRDASTVTPQVFSLFNSQIAYDRAVAFAVRLSEQARGFDEQLEHAFQSAFGRSPTPTERRACQTHYHAMVSRHEADVIPKPTYPTTVVREAVEENTGEKFSFTEQLDVFEDFVPDLKMADVPPPVRALAEICLVLFNSNEFAYVY